MGMERAIHIRDRTTDEDTTTIYRELTDGQRQERRKMTTRSVLVDPALS
jgi:hypothetical protein